ncbi:ParB family protein [Arthrobacter echini]|uniref:ParB family protein n=1 Tax=Arthrobacter echini TaxID=1529066 RepID=UPI001652A3D5
MAARIRGAFQATAHLESHRSFSDFHASVMEAELERLEAKYNNGQPYEKAAPRSGRLGRPLE